jgi:hypothetical protein
MVIDAFSYHHYGATSMRCAAIGKQATAAEALSEQWLRRTDETLAFYRRLRERVRTRQTVLEHRDGGCGVRRQYAFAPTTITFLALPCAENDACR